VSGEQTQTQTGRGRRTVGDMVRSLAVVMVLVGVIVVFNVAEQPDPVVRDIDYAGAVAQAREQAPFEVLAPDPLPEGWRATSARTRPDGTGVTWHLGLVTDRENYAGVEQSDGADRRGFVDRFASGAERAGTVEVGDRTWRRLDGGEPETRALVSTRDGVVTVVAGGARWEELEELAGSLRGG
jgi:Protein of unknown function (DUF4245)